MRFQPRKALSEAMVQAEFYNACKEAGLGCFLEYRSKWNGMQECRFDAVIHDGVEILAIAEIKSYRRPEKAYLWYGRKQAAKYGQYGVPLFLISSLDDIQPTISGILRNLGRRG